LREKVFHQRIAGVLLLCPAVDKEHRFIYENNLSETMKSELKEKGVVEIKLGPGLIGSMPIGGSYVDDDLMKHDFLADERDLD
jgi:hypothetical protein